MAEHTFASVSVGLGGSGVKLQDGTRLEGLGQWKDEHGRLRPHIAKCIPDNLVFVRVMIKSGGGLSIISLQEWLVDRGEGWWYLPAPVTRGHDGATERDLASVPGYVRAAYDWWLNR